MLVTEQIQRTEREYRGLDMDSSSTLKDFADDRKKYVKKYVYGEPVKPEKDDSAVKLGRIVETLLLEDEAVFDRKFQMSTCSKLPTGKMMDFCEALLEQSMLYRNEQGELTRTFGEISREAHSLSGYDIGYDIVIKRFNDGVGVLYYREKLSEVGGKTIVTTEERSFAQAIAN